MKKNVLITGGFGLLGQSLVRKIDKKKYNIFLLDKIKYKKRNRFLYDNHKKINIVHGNFNNIKFISKLIKVKKIKIIFQFSTVQDIISLR